MAEAGIAKVYHTPMRSPMKKSLVARFGSMLVRAGIEPPSRRTTSSRSSCTSASRATPATCGPSSFARSSSRIRAAGGKPFLTDANTLYRGKRANSVDHLTSAIRNGFDYAVGRRARS